jgi:hypothetical protein
MEPIYPQEYYTVRTEDLQKTWVDPSCPQDYYSEDRRTGDLGEMEFLQDYYSEDCSPGWSQDVRTITTVRIGDLGGTRMSAGLLT